MGFKIWRKDNTGWWLAFDIIFNSKDKADEYIQELNAKYSDKVKYGELSFFSYRDDIKISKDGSIIDLTKQYSKRKGHHKRNYNESLY